MDIKSLEEDEIQTGTLILYHESNPEKKYKFTLRNLWKSGFIQDVIEDKDIINNPEGLSIPYGDEFSFIELVKYLDFYENKTVEIAIPPAPLPPSTSLKDIFSIEYIIFKDVIELSDVVDKLLKVRKIINLAQFMRMESLWSKWCAIASFIIIEIPRENREMILSKVEQFAKNKPQ